MYNCAPLLTFSLPLPLSFSPSLPPAGLQEGSHVQCHPFWSHHSGAMSGALHGARDPLQGGSMVRIHSQTGLGMRPKHSLVPRPPPFFVLQFPFSIIHRSGVLYYTERKPKNKKRGRPVNKLAKTCSCKAFYSCSRLLHIHTYLVLVPCCRRTACK